MSFEQKVQIENMKDANQFMPEIHPKLFPSKDPKEALKELIHEVLNGNHINTVEAPCATLLTREHMEEIPPYPFFPHIDKICPPLKLSE